MRDERESENLAAQVVLDELARAASPDDTAVVPPDDEVAEVLGRLYLEAFGLLAYGVEPAAAPEGARGALLARLAGEETQEVEPIAAPEPVAAPEPIVAPQPAPRVASAPLPPRPAPPPGSPAAIDGTRDASRSDAHPTFRSAAMASRPPRRGRGALWAALGLALIAVGAGVYATYLYSELASQRARQTRIEREAGAAEAAARAESAELEARLEELRRRHDFVTTPAVTVWALRPPAAARQPLARGALWLAPDGHRWLLEARGLAPDPPGRDYQLWFIVDGLPLSAGLFGVEAGRPATLEDVEFPVGVTGVALTLEREGGAPAPSGAPLLLGTAPVRL